MLWFIVTLIKIILSVLVEVIGLQSTIQGVIGQFQIGQACSTIIPTSKLCDTKSNSQ